MNVRWVVVGAGTAGCVVAARLSAAGYDVTLVEAGPATSAPATASFFDALAESGRTYPGAFVRGRGLGGSGAINGMVATPGDLRQYEQWGWTDAAEALARVQVPWSPPAQEDLGPIDRALLAAAPDAAPVPLTRRDGHRVTAADAYLPGSGVDVRADAEVVRVLLDGTTAAGVALADGSTIAADRVAVAAGALGSPALLAASGVEVAGLGDGLRNHPAVPISLRLRPGVDVDVHGLVTGTLLRRGDLQVLPLNHLGPGTPGTAMLLAVVMRPTGVGTGCQQHLSAHDRARVDTGVDLVRELLDHAAFRTIVDEVTVGEAPAGVFHATSTCAMGRVVDDDGAVRGHEHLHVVDASVFPDIPAANVHVPTLMLAERLAARLTPP